MNKHSKKIKYQEDKLYNKILLLSRNKLLYTRLNLKDSFQNRINLIFLHISFLFIKIKHNNVNSHYKEFYQKMFDIVFKKIELNMREVGHGDVKVNKNMKFLVKAFYDILLFCQDYRKKNKEYKRTFFSQYLKSNTDKKIINNDNLIKYFHAFQTFCFDLSSDSVLKGELKFKFN